MHGTEMSKLGIFGYEDSLIKSRLIMVMVKTGKKTI